MAVDRDKILQAAQKLVEKKRYDKAVVEYQKLVADDPKDIRTLLRIGDLFVKMGQYADAVLTYERVGQFYSSQAFHLKAIAVYKQIREIINKHAPQLEDRFGHIVPRLAETYQQLGLTSDALAAYDEVATRHQKAGREREAIEVFRKLIDLDPQNPLVHLRLGEALLRAREVDEAIGRFGAAAEILLKLGRRDDALKVVERLLQHRADTKFARIATEIYLERGEANDAMAALAKLQIAFKEDPKDLGTLALLSRVFDKLGQPAKSIEVQKEAARIARDAGKLDHFNALVEALVSRAPNDEAVRHLASLRAPTAPSKIEEEEAEEVEVSVVDDDDPAASAVPFPLQQAIPAAPPPVPTAPTAPVDPAARARQVLAAVDAHRRNKDYDSAVALLFESVEALPASREIREKLCDVLIEAGDQAEAVRQMLTFARWLAQSNDVDGAARILDEVLLLEPSQADALAMLRELGYAVPSEEGAEAAAAAWQQPAQEGYDPGAPLPSYDLEEIGPGAALGTSRSFAPSQLDDPFDVNDAPLPSFPMEDEQAEAAPRETSSVEVSAGPREPVEEDVAASPPFIASVRPPDAGGGFDEDALEEVEFFVAQGMFEEARNLLEEQLLRLPNHPLLLERLREVEEHAAAAQGGGSGTRAVPRPAPPGPAPFTLEDRAFDIAASLDALDALDAGPQQAPASSADPNQVSVESVFEQFKAGVAAQISESDAATHYDLGVAYQEMGLFTDAIQEFDLAARDPNRECVCQSMIGVIHRQLGNVDAAIDAYIRGLHAQVKTREQELALTYEIGDCYEERRATDQALYYFQRVVRMDATYADMRGSAAERVQRLAPPPAAPQRPPPAKAVGAEHDEFDGLLDDLDLVGGSKLP
ncbi:TPR domain protein [Minicystis rosea]|nr:TPR domain protein [Minicystis rosea]